MLRTVLGICVLGMSTTALGQTVAEKLSVPKTVVVAPPPATAAPTARTKSDELTVHQSRGPAADLVREPRVLPGELKRARPRYAAVDAPPIPAESSPTAPEFRPLPAGLPAAVATTNAQQTPALNRFDRTPELPPQIADDPTHLPAHAVVIGTQGLPVTNAPAALKLALPDPFVNSQRIRLKETPADSDSPSTLIYRPDRPTLSPPPAPMPMK